MKKKHQYCQKNIQILEKLLHDPAFQKMVEDEIGEVDRPVVYWEENEIIFIGTKHKKILKIDETLKILNKEKT